MGEQRESETQRLVGGELCIDFANTVNGHAHLPHHEYLQDYEDMVLWGGHASVLNAKEMELLLKKARVDSGEAGAVYRRGLELRETIFRLFSSAARGKKAGADDLEHLNASWRNGMRHAELTRSTKGFELGWDDEPCLERPLRVVTESAVKLLTSPLLQQVRQCEGEGCDWLFIDTSRNHLRKWCSMEECGNRAKMRRRKRRNKGTLLVLQ
ncbi:MAG: CGNR zinc finger domain-containing protein [Anaerolineales bacterium]